MVKMKTYFFFILRNLKYMFTVAYLKGKSPKLARDKSALQTGQLSGSSLQNTFGPQCWKHIIPGSMFTEKRKTA